MRFWHIVKRAFIPSRTCPHCGMFYWEKPLRKTKCKTCGESFCVRTSPYTKRKRLVTDTVAERYSAVFEQRSVAAAKQRRKQLLRTHRISIKSFYKNLKNHHDIMPYIQVTTMEDENVCVYCRGQNRTIYHYKKAPRFPLKKCTCKDGCRCMPVLLQPWQVDETINGYRLK